MTTIAVRGRIMAADSLVMSGQWVLPEVAVKIHRLADNSLYGHSGRHRDAEAVAWWLGTGMHAEPPVCGEGSGGLWLKLDGSIWYVEVDKHGERPAVMQVGADFSAEGSGRGPALAAMMAGADAAEAVAIACRLDPHSGGDVRVERLP